MHWLAQASCPPDVQGGNQEVNILTTRFGLIQACESDLIRFRKDCSGSARSPSIVHLPDPVVTGLSWLQSVTAPELAFGLVAAPPGGQRLPDRAPPGRPGGTRAGRRTVGADLRDPEPRRGGGPDGQPPGAAGLQPDPPPRPATGVDLQPLRGAVSPGHVCFRPGTNLAARAVTAARDGVTRCSSTA